MRKIIPTSTPWFLASYNLTAGETAPWIDGRIKTCIASCRWCPILCGYCLLNGFVTKVLCGPFLPSFLFLEDGVAGKPVNSTGRNSLMDLFCYEAYLSTRSKVGETSWRWIGHQQHNGSNTLKRKDTQIQNMCLFECGWISALSVTEGIQ